MDRSDEQLDNLLKAHLDAELETQVGSAAAGFTAYRRRQQWIRWTAGSAIAACLAVAVLFPYLRDHPTLPVAKHNPNVARARPIQAEYAVFTRTTGEKTVCLDGKVPMREARRQVLQKVGWYDPEQQAQVEVRIPREEVVLVPMLTY